MKSKLGISIKLLGAAVFFIGLFGGYTPVLLLGGYILLKEENDWLRHCAIKAIVVMGIFSLASYAIDVLPTFSGIITRFIGIFSSYPRLGFNAVIADILNIIDIIISLGRIVVLGLLGIKALKVQDLSIPFVDKFIDKLENN